MEKRRFMHLINMPRLVYLLFFIASLHCFAQETDRNKSAVFIDEEGNFLRYLNKNIRYPASMRNQCVQAAFLAKFDISAKGTVDTVYFSVGTPQEFREELSRVLKQTSGKWLPKLFKGKPTADKNCVLPVEYKLVDNPECPTHTNAIQDIENLFRLSDGKVLVNCKILLTVTVIGIGATIYCGPTNGGVEIIKRKSPPIPTVNIRIPYKE